LKTYLDHSVSGLTGLPPSPRRPTLARLLV
jgi:hypothetical protein